MPMQAIYKILIVQETTNLTYIDSDEKETIKYFEPQFKNNTYLQKDREPLNAFFPPFFGFSRQGFLQHWNLSWNLLL